LAGAGGVESDTGLVGTGGLEAAGEEALAEVGFAGAEALVEAAFAGAEALAGEAFTLSLKAFLPVRNIAPNEYCL